MHLCKAALKQLLKSYVNKNDLNIQCHRYVTGCKCHFMLTLTAKTRPVRTAKIPPRSKRAKQSNVAEKYSTFLSHDISVEIQL